LTEHLEGAQVILIFQVANLQTAVREIIEHCGQIGGRFEMPYAVGARLITTRGHSGWRTRRPARSAGAVCGSPRILTDPYVFGPVSVAVRMGGGNQGQAHGNAAVTCSPIAWSRWLGCAAPW
jgi:hypothetical protein